MDDRGGREAVPNAAPGQGGLKTSMTLAEARGGKDPVETLTMIALALKNHGIDSEIGVEAGVEQLIDQAYRDRKRVKALEATIAEAVERMAGPLGRARVRSGGPESQTEQARDLNLVVRGMTILRAALAPERS